VKTRAVIDTNVLFAGYRSKSPTSPNIRLLERWQAGHFTWLYSRDTLGEYARKLIELGIDPPLVRSFLALLVVAGEETPIMIFHERHYPDDPDDIAFLLCAVNGRAGYLVSYDRHLTSLDGFYDFRICPPVEFLTCLERQG